MKLATTTTRFAVGLTVLLGFTLGAFAARAAEPEPAPQQEAAPERPAKPGKGKRPTSDLPLAHAKLGRYWMFLAPIELELSLGWANGWMNRDVDGLVVSGDVAVEPQLRFRKGRFRLRAPLAAGQEVTIGFALPETRLGAGLVASGRLGDTLELAASTRLARRWRPGWADFYQPLLDGDSEPAYEPDGSLGTTDRFGRTAITSTLGLEYTPSKAVDIELALEVEQRLDDHDRKYDPVLAPTHLVPNDLTRWGASLHLRTEPIDNRLHAGLAFSIDAYDYLFAFARDAGTGATHAGIGGEPANPLQSFLRWSLTPDASLFVPALKTRFMLDLRWVHNSDRFADYYTWDSFGGTLAIRVRPVKDVKLEVGYALDVRSYTRSGYQAGPTHAPLESGSVRERTQRELTCELAWSLAEDTVEPFIEARWQEYDDTMPDYEPWTNPPREPYRVDFDADWWVARVGLRMKL